ncbi:MmcQ/YjbR family DNA-binding protein [Paenibacillus hodogayensis]|uniref:MmcQ/YjbR family DNA-binding protein n=1 Tax=Paenibacillus hodogayensis TaxID=279208 RepID=A0ABV5VY85_9BACL
MDYKELTAYCLSKTGAYEDYPFGPDPLVMKVASKIFAFFSVVDGWIHIALKCEPEAAELLRLEYAAVKPGYHLNKRHWNTVVIDGTIPAEELRGMIDHSYTLVVRKLTRAEKERIG